MNDNEALLPRDQGLQVRERAHDTIITATPRRLNSTPSSKP